MSYAIDDDKVIYANLDPKEGVVLHLDTKNYYRLNETGQVIWQGLQDRQTPETIARRISELFEVTPETALKDVREMINQMKREALLLGTDTQGTSDQMNEARQSKKRAG